MRSNARRKVFVGILLMIMAGAMVTLYVMSAMVDDSESGGTATTSYTPTPKSDPVPLSFVSEPDPIILAKAGADAASAGINGEVVLPDGLPAAGATVTAFAMSRADGGTVTRSPAAVSQTTVDDLGYFTLAGLEPGWYDVLAVFDELQARTNVTAPNSRLLRMRLQEYGTISGKVVDADGNPIAGAEVVPVARNKEPIAVFEQAAFRVTTDAAGVFTIERIEQAVWRLAARASGYGTGIADGVKTGTEDCNIVLMLGSTLEGIVLDAESNEPIADIAVVCKWLDESVGPASAMTNAAGEFRFDGLAQGLHVVSLRSESFAIDKPIEVAFSGDGESRAITLKALPAGSVSGSVFLDNAETPIGGVSVVATDLAYRHLEMKARTDDAGHYRITGLHGGEFEVRAGVSPYPSRAVVVGVGVTTDGIDFVVPSKRSIDGRVVDVRNQPVPRAEVRLVAPDPNALPGNLHLQSLPQIITVTGSDGTFHMEVNPPKHAVMLTAYHVSGTSDTVADLPLHEQDIQDLVLTIRNPAEAVASGVITTKDGRPVPGVVDFKETGVEIPHYAYVRADASGRFSTRLKAPARYAVRVGPADVVIRFTTEAPALSVGPGEHRTDLRYVLDDEDLGGSISGRVVTSAGIAVNNKPVSVRPSDSYSSGSGSGGVVYTDSSGYFEITGLDQPRYNLRLNRPNGEWYTAMSDVPVNTDSVVLVEDEGFVITGQVIEARTGKPIQQFNIFMGTEMPTRNGFGRDVSYRQDFSSVDGSFRYVVSEEQALGNYVVATVPGRIRGGAYVPPGSTSPVEVVIPIDVVSGTAIDGTVVDSSGATLPGAQVYVNRRPPRDAQPSQADTTTDASGQFHVARAPEGEIEVWAAHPNYAPAYQTVSVVAGETSQVEIMLQAAATIEGVVLENGVPVADVMLEVTPASAQRFARTDADGRYRFSPINSGECQVTILSPESGPGEETDRIVATKVCTVGPNEVCIVDFSLPEDGDIPGNQSEVEKSRLASGI